MIAGQPEPRALIEGVFLLPGSRRAPELSSIRLAEVPAIQFEQL